MRTAEATSIMVAGVGEDAVGALIYRFVDTRDFDGEDMLSKL
jgi:hypothetical protein